MQQIAVRVGCNAGKHFKPAAQLKSMLTHAGLAGCKADDKSHLSRLSKPKTSATTQLNSIKRTQSPLAFTASDSTH
jgi:hypothetical protein